MTGLVTDSGADFVGAKLALLAGDAVLTYLRDDFAHIPFPGQWDLPGGGREGDETPRDCVLRELHEEFGLRLGAERLHWARVYPSVTPPGSLGWFFVGFVTAEEIAAIRFGDEGQHWRMMPVAEFLRHERAVSFLQQRLAAYLSQTARPGRADASGGSI